MAARTLSPRPALDDRLALWRPAVPALPRSGARLSRCALCARPVAWRQQLQPIPAREAPRRARTTTRRSHRPYRRRERLLHGDPRRAGEAMSCRSPECHDRRWRGTDWPQTPVDGVYVNFRVARPADRWIENLAPSGQLLVPLGLAREKRPHAAGRPRRRPPAFPI